MSDNVIRTPALSLATLTGNAEPVFEEAETEFLAPTSLLERWEGVLELIPSDEYNQLSAVSTQRLFLTDFEAEADIMWTASGYDLLYTIMAQPLEGRLESAGNEYLVFEGQERRAARRVHEHLKQQGLDETAISNVMSILQEELSDLQNVSGRCLTEIVRYRMRDDGSALTRVTGDTTWPLMINASAETEEP